MQLAKFAFAAVLGLLSPWAKAAGLTKIEIPADADGPAIRALVWSPCAVAPAEIKLGPYLLPAVRDCPIVGDRLPLVVISHGHGGSYFGHHDTAETLADAGFIVVALNHPGDTATDMSHAGDLAVLLERPTDVKRVIDFMLGASPDAARIDPQRIGFFGFSRGGYTGLVIAGARPDFGNAGILCPVPQAPICAQIRSYEAAPQPLTHDPRIKALAIADPLSFFPTPASLSDVKAPIQLWGSERGGDGVTPESVAALVGDLPAKPEFHPVPNAAHFAFLAPCPPDLRRSRPELCTDAPGFDRVAFHQEMDARVLSFFRQHLPQ